jgi:arylsulfatase A-like enzyme
MYTNIMLDKMKNHQADGKPLFMYLSFQASHSPFQAPQKSMKKYEGVYDVGYDKIREQRFEKQKQLGIWPQNMTLPQRLPQTPAWDSLNATDKAYKAKVLEARAGMIDNMDSDVGRVIQYLKDTGQYDNTLILFTSDNGSSEPVEMKNLGTGEVEEANKFLNSFNNSLANVGNADSLVNYSAWGAGGCCFSIFVFQDNTG